MKKVALLVVGCFILVSVAQANKTEDVWLLPAKAGKKSEIVKSLPDLILHLGDKPVVDMEIGYVDTTKPAGWLRGNWSLPESICTAFEPPAPCSVLSFRTRLRSSFGPDPSPCILFFALGDPSIDYCLDYDDYHVAGCSPGPAPFPGGIYDSVTVLPDTGLRGAWYSKDITNPPDVGMTPFIAGHIKFAPDSQPNVLVQPGRENWPAPADVQSLVWRPDPASGIPGWYSNWHIYWTFAKVRMYGNPPPVITKSYDKSDTYNTGPITIQNDVKDMGIPLDSSGVQFGYIFYYKKPDTIFTDTIAMKLVAGDSTKGTWSGDIPGHAVGDTIVYTTLFIDYQGRATAGPTYQYIIRAGTPGNALVILSGSEYYGRPVSPNPWSNISALCPVDFWWEKKYGAVDSSVLYFYKDGPGKKAIFVHTWGADPIRSDSAFFMEFLNAGGKLAISSQDMAGEWAKNYDTVLWAPGTFIHDYLKVNKVIDDYYGIYNMDSAFTNYGTPPIGGAPLLDEFKVAPYIWVPRLGYNYAGVFLEYDAACLPIFLDPAGRVQGYAYEDPTAGSKVVNIYWPFHYLWISGSRNRDSCVWNTEAQDTLAARIYAYLMGAEEQPSRPPVVYWVSKVMPNPTNSKSSISYGIPRAGKISVKVYDISGSLVRTLVDEAVKPGVYTVTWDGCNNHNRPVRSGLYFYKLEADKFSETRKFTLIR